MEFAGKALVCCAHAVLFIHDATGADVARRAARSSDAGRLHLVPGAGSARARGGHRCAEHSFAPPTPTPAVSTAAPVSDIQSSVDTFVAALDELGIEHSEPVRAEVGESGAKARFDITVSGFDAGINVFPDADTLAAWGELSDAYGGIFVSWGNAALSLNSSEGIANSAKIAPAIAEAIGGVARGV